VSGEPLIERAAATVADGVPGQVATVFLAYQVIGSLICTLAFEPAMRVLQRLAPPSSLQELSKPAFLLVEALVDPSLAVELAAREEARLIERLPMMLDDIRSDATPDADAPALLRAASQSVGGAVAHYLANILAKNLDRVQRERVIRLQHRTATLMALFDALGEFSGAALSARQWPASASVAANMVEALHALLSALLDATRSTNPDDREFVLKLLGHRDELMERMRQRVLRENPALPASAQDSLFAATMLFERIVWLARQMTLLMAPPAGAAPQAATLQGAAVERAV
jgi:phosphate:Na+ symporter